MIRTAAARCRRQAAKALQGAGAKHAHRASYTTVTKLAGAASSHLGTAAAVLAVAGTSFAMQPLLHAKSSKSEKTYIMVKPDGVQRALVGEIISRFERKGYKLVAIKVIVPSKELASEHYAEHDGKPFFPKLVDFLSSGAVVGMVWEGEGVINYGRTLIGATNPLASAPGTIRGDYGIAVGRNIVHGSDSPASAQREISLWFSSAELAEYNVSNRKWIYE